MAKSTRPDHYVVDGSNIATEGRSVPSLAQLNEAVLAFMEEHRGAVITVVVDATFGHRIDKKEVKGFDEAVANNELVTPPAGAIGRGDAFVLTIARKADAGVLSNDSFQEFHGETDWLFDEGRLIGGKPVPHVGWVFVDRTPVRGPKSRQSVREAKQGTKSAPKTAAKERANRRVRAKAAEPETESTTRSATDSTKEVAKDAAPAGRSRRGRGRDKTGAPKAEEARSGDESGPKDQINELMPFLDFVEHHPVGTSCTGVVESYASHGAYARVGDVLIYIPLRLMDDPAPRSARSALTVGEAVALVIVGYVPDRRSIDAAVPHMAAVALAAAADESVSEQATQRTAAKKTSAKKTTAKKTAKKTTAKTAAKKTSAKKTTAKKTAPKKTAAKKAPTKKVPAKKVPAKKAATRKTAARKAPVKRKAAARKAPAKKAAAKKASG